MDSRRPETLNSNFTELLKVVPVPLHQGPWDARVHLHDETGHWELALKLDQYGLIEDMGWMAPEGAARAWFSLASRSWLGLSPSEAFAHAGKVPFQTDPLYLELASDGMLPVLPVPALLLEAAMKRLKLQLPRYQLAKEADQLVCRCFSVTKDQAQAWIENAGSNELAKAFGGQAIAKGCRSCLPELKTLLDQYEMVDSGVDRKVCRCLSVMESEIKEAYQTHKNASDQKIMQLTMAGTRCGSCHDDVKEIGKKVRGSTPARRWKERSPVQWIESIQQFLATASPLLPGQAVNFEVVQFSQGVVYLRPSRTLNGDEEIDMGRWLLGEMQEQLDQDLVFFFVP